MESKAFPGSFVRRIEFDGHEVGVEYTMPNKPETCRPALAEFPILGAVAARPGFEPGF